MDAIYLTLPVALLVGLIFLGLFYWAWKSGQFDDMEGPSERMIHQDDEDGPVEDEKGQN